MSDLLGWGTSVVRLTNELLRELKSSAPYYSFAIQGERRSGRTTFFKQMSKLINDDPQSGAVCFECQLDQASLSDISSKLIQSVRESGQSSEDYSAMERSLQHPNGFFDLLSEITRREGKKPVFLLDMGSALEGASNNAILEVGRYFKIIANFKEHKNIPFALGCGWTRTFFDKAVVIAGDVYRDRYRTVRYLGNSFEDENPFKVFRAIVKKISSVDLPEEFAGLMRVPGITAGMYGENMECHGISEVPSSEDIWRSLQGVHTLIPQLAIQDAELSFSQLTELLITDGTIQQNICPIYLDFKEDSGYRAKDDLYVHFGLVPPRRDPSILERLKNRLEDPEDEEVLNEIFSPLREVLSQFWSADNLYSETFKNRTAILSANLNRAPWLDENAPTGDRLGRLIDNLALPKQITVGLYLDSPDSSKFENNLLEAAQSGNFVLVLYPTGAQDINKISLGRRLKGKCWHSVSLSEDNLLQLISSEEENSSRNSIILEWIQQCHDGHLREKPSIPILHEIGKKLVSAVVANSGMLKIENFNDILEVSKRDFDVLCNKLIASDVLRKKKGLLIWDPAEDPILSAILGGERDNDSIIERLKEYFSLPITQVETRHLLQVYAGVFENKNIVEINIHEVLVWYYSHRSILIRPIEKMIESESQIAEQFGERFQKLQDETVDDWEDIGADRDTIESLKFEIDAAILELKANRRKETEEISSKKNELQELIELNKAHLTNSEIETMYRQVDGIRSISSRSINEIKSKIRERNTNIENLFTAASEFERRLIKLKVLRNSTKAEEISAGLLSVKNFAENINLESADRELANLTNKLEDLEKEEQKRILFGVPPVGPPPVDPPLVDPPPVDPPPIDPPPVDPPPVDPPPVDPPPVDPPPVDPPPVDPPPVDPPPVDPPPVDPPPVDPPPVDPPLQEDDYEILVKEQIRSIIKLFNDPNVEIKRIRTKFH